MGGAFEEARTRRLFDYERLMTIVAEKVLDSPIKDARHQLRYEALRQAALMYKSNIASAGSVV